MVQLFARIRNWFDFSYGQKVFLLATVPLVLAVTLISLVVTSQSRQLAEREIAVLESQLIQAKQDELKNYLSIARTAVVNTYGRAAPDDEEAKLAVSRELAAMLYGQDGYFFVFDYDGMNLVAPRQTDLINKNWSGLEDGNGIPITDELIRIARTGGGYHSFEWPKPSTGELGQMVVYVNGLQDWRWVVGTGIFIDDVVESVAAARADVEDRINRTSFYILIIASIAVLGVFLSGLVLNIRERRLADVKLKALTQRIIDTQEEERSRVARELHDGISQMLVGVRYALELTRRRIGLGDERSGESLEKGIDGLGEAIQEVRRISRDLRPGVLDDLGLGPALQALTDDFSTRTSIDVEFETVVFRNRLDQEARIALYRIAQEALTNIERHAQASHVSVSLKGNRRGALLRISDDGTGMVWPAAARGRVSGLGLRNMQERIEQIGGSLRVMSSEDGTTIDAQVPLTHMLRPQDPQKESA
ncbi:two-component system, NarL family, sensor kinase [Cognatiyoonia sediminum]|uniref:histidine kinase n=1 Tax=Cognatiyoonia sediminum TaxID=1508389 RepID=A0A1M5MJL1_9RHOB|nr:cache domain-containing protein [Cognatiyoonia sediminum]SHG77674.1 two-component system, NarL family, sensor kinase [Cognatiyoonia sediminum]